MNEVQKLELEIAGMARRPAELRHAQDAPEIADYAFATLDGGVRLSALFAGRERLLLIHNMGQACRYCALWADGLNGLLDHLEDGGANVKD